jgi:hypothetical protein
MRQHDDVPTPRIDAAHGEQACPAAECGLHAAAADLHEDQQSAQHRDPERAEAHGGQGK